MGGLRGRVVERDIDLLRRFVEADEAFRPEQHGRRPSAT